MQGRRLTPASLTSASSFLPVGPGCPLSTLDPSSLASPHSEGEGQWDEAGEAERTDSQRAGSGLCGEETLLGLPVCVPPQSSGVSAAAAAGSGRRSTTLSSPSEGQGASAISVFFADAWL